MTDTSPEQIDRLWEEAVNAAQLAQDRSTDKWSHGYRAGLLQAYALITGLPERTITAALSHELKARS